MRLVVAAIGRLKRGPERDLAERYRDRAVKCGRGIGFRGIDVFETDESRARRADDRANEEAAALSALIPENALIIALDERGESLGSAALAERLGRWRDQGQPAATFVIGGADGLSEGLRKRASLRLAFGAATWPHQMVRIMLLEQLYRAMTILSGHPYHRE
ncbi:MAG TPA: 23S rRNA (pseudouridine(1915)-N(3))-methyltransferase RlmH [Xanthobacteraceae bacterium]|jgi:23S rRNA (pseudouridine1915-N3)-methyltransferase|nr:23S rRNA (pseudouridine(1915)-N(3))-methyltransferase RlmH [Xanthobacteraceae bacterium]